MAISFYWPIVIAYLVITMGVGLWAKSKVKDTADLMVAGRKAGRWLIAFSITATWINGATLIGGTGGGYKLGAGDYWQYIGFMVATIWFGIYIVPKIRRLNIMTTPQIFGRYFGDNARVVSLILVMVRDMAATAGTLLSMTLLTMTFFGVSLPTALLVTYVFTVVYCMAGGQWAVLWTDAIQFFILVAGTIGAFVGGIIYLGGWSAFTAAIPDPKLIDFIGPAGGKQIVAWIIMGTFVTFGYQSILQKGLCARDDLEAKWGFIWGGIFGCIWYMLPYLLGVLGAAAFGTKVSPDQIYLKLTTAFYGPVGIALFFSAFLASCMSTISSTVIAISSNFTIDIFKRFIKPDSSEKQLLWVGRLNIALAALIAALVAYTVPLITELFYIGGRILASTVSVVLVGMIFYKPVRRSPKSVLASMIIGGIVVTSFILAGNTASIVKGVIAVWKIDPIYPGMLATILTLIIGIYFESKNKNASEKAVEEKSAL